MANLININSNLNSAHPGTVELPAPSRIAIPFLRIPAGASESRDDAFYYYKNYGY